METIGCVLRGELTSASLLPQQLRAAGIEFHEFLEKQVDLARRLGERASGPVAARRAVLLRGR